MREASQLPPGPGSPRLKQLYRFVAEPLEFFADSARDCGPIFTMHLLGQDPWVMLGDPDAVRTAFRMSADELHSGSDAMKYLVGQHVILFHNGEEHRRERRILTPPFKHERMATYAERMLDRADDAIDGLAVGAEVCAIDLVQQVTLKVIVECVFGISHPVARDRLSALLERHLGAMQTPHVAFLAMAVGGERFRAIVDEGTKRRRASARLDGPLPSSKNPLLRFLDTKVEMDAMLQAELDRCRAEPGDRDDVLALLARATYDDGRPMSDQALLDELFALLLAGHETSAITLSWALWFLAREPAILARAIAELDEVFGDGPITARGVERLRYLSAIVDETLRVRPVATSVPRRLPEATTLGGHALPAGTRVFPAAAILHFRPDLWPEPHAFKPERFLDQKPSPFHYLPFGGGSRACLGRPFALVEMRLVLAQILRRLDFALAPSTNPKPQLRGLLVGPSDGVPLVVKRVRPRMARRARVEGAISA